MLQHNKVGSRHLNQPLALIPVLGMLLAVSASSAATGNLGLTSAPGGFELLSPAAPTLLDYLSI